MIAPSPLGRTQQRGGILAPAHPLRRGMLAQVVITPAGVHDRLANRVGVLKTKAAGRGGFFGAVGDGSTANGVEYNSIRLQGLSGAGSFSVAWHQANIANNSGSIWALVDDVWSGVDCYADRVLKNSNGGVYNNWGTIYRGAHVYTQTAAGAAATYALGDRTPKASATGLSFDAVTLTRLWMLKNPYVGGFQSPTAGATVNHVTVWNRALTADEAVLWMNEVGKLYVPHPGRRSVLLTTAPAQQLLASGIDNTIAVGTAVVLDSPGAPSFATASGIDNTIAVGTATALRQVAVAALAGLDATAAFGTPSLDVPAGTVMTSIAPTSDAGTPAVAAPSALLQSPMLGGSAVGSPVFVQPIIANLWTIAPQSAVGEPTIGTPGNAVLTAGIGSSTELGTPSVVVGGAAVVAGIAGTAVVAVPGVGTACGATAAPTLNETVTGQLDVRAVSRPSAVGPANASGLGVPVVMLSGAPGAEQAFPGLVAEELIPYRRDDRTLLDVPAAGRYAPTRKQDRPAFVGSVDAARVAGVQLDAGQYDVRFRGDGADQAIVLTPADPPPSD